MGLFSRRRPADPSGEAPERVGDSAPVSPPQGRRGTAKGPWDITEVPDLGARLDIGALRIPGVPGMQLRMEMDQKGSRVVAANLGVEGSALQVQAFAAPRTEGIWDELRQEIAASVTKQGGTADDAEGPFGTELVVRLPVRTPDGRSGHRPARFLGVDGPRWFVRGVLTGQAAIDREAATQLEALFADIVVVRGDEARAPRDPLPLHLPGRPPSDLPASPEKLGLEQLRRGPEITETR